MNEHKNSEQNLDDDQVKPVVTEQEEVEVQSNTQEPAEQPKQDESEQEPGEQISIDELQLKIAMLTEELESANDRSLRAQAEVENIRRRSAVEQVNIRKFAIEGFAAELLAVKDSLDLAEQVELTEDNKDVINKMQEGLTLTLKQLNRVFEKFAIEIVDPEKGEKLNPDLHQAMTVQPSDEVEPNCVLHVIQKGYKLHDRLLRPAMVVIAKKIEQKSDETD